MLEVRGLEGRGRSPEVEEAEILGSSCDWCGRAMKRTSGAVEENRGSFRSGPQNRESIFHDQCLDCSRIAVICSLLVCGPGECGEGSSTFWLTQCLHYSLQFTLGFDGLRLELDHPRPGAPRGRVLSDSSQGPQTWGRTWYLNGLREG